MDQEDRFKRCMDHEDRFNRCMDHEDRFNRCMDHEDIGTQVFISDHRYSSVYK